MAAQVRVVEFSSSTPFKEQLEVMARTGLYVSVHTSNLANTPFLPPNAVVVELIQRNWAWYQIDQSFESLTRQMGGARLVRGWAVCLAPRVS